MLDPFIEALFVKEMLWITPKDRNFAWSFEFNVAYHARLFLLEAERLHFFERCFHAG